MSSSFDCLFSSLEIDAEYFAFKADFEKQKNDIKNEVYWVLDLRDASNNQKEDFFHRFWKISRKYKWKSHKNKIDKKGITRKLDSLESTLDKLHKHYAFSFNNTDLGMNPISKGLYQYSSENEDSPNIQEMKRYLEIYIEHCSSMRADVENMKNKHYSPNFKINLIHALIGEYEFYFKIPTKTIVSEFKSLIDSSFNLVYGEDCGVEIFKKAMDSFCAESYQNKDWLESYM